MFVAALIVFASAFQAPKDFVGVDLGGEFIKFAQFDSRTNLTGIYHLPDLGSILPDALAYKSNRTFTRILAEDADDVESVAGEEALELIDQNSSVGFRYLLQILNRNETEFQTTTIGDPIESLALLWTHMITAIRYVPQIYYAVPIFWPRELRQSFANSVIISHVPLTSIIDDTTALSMLYVTEKSERYIHLTEQSYYVLFVDVGFGSTKVYSIDFSYRVNASYAHQNSIHWSEDVSSYQFAKTVAAANGVNLTYVHRVLTSDNAASLLAPQLKKLQELIGRAVSDLAAIGAEPDEVQLIGGASLYPFVVEAVKSAVGRVPVKQEFPARHAIALGAVHTALYERDMRGFEKPKHRVFVVSAAIANVTLQCNGTHQYCVRGQACVSPIKEAGVCEVITMTTAPESVPRGVSPVIAQFKIEELPNETAEGDYVVLHTKTEEPGIERADLCNATNCTKYDVRGMSIDAPVMTEKMKFISQMMRAKIQRDQRKYLMRQIRSMVEQAEPVLGSASVAAEVAPGREAGGDVTATGGDVTSTGGDVTATGGDVTATGGDVTATGGDVTATGGDVTATGGDVTATGGDVTGGEQKLTPEEAAAKRAVAVAELAEISAQYKAGAYVAYNRSELVDVTSRLNKILETLGIEPQ
jgi:hypothetical protein